MTDAAAPGRLSRAINEGNRGTSTMQQPVGGPVVPPPWDGHYVIVNNKGPLLEKLPDNYIRTTKYTILTFLPLNLYAQFRRFYNLYFLAAALLAIFMPEASPISPSTTITPLVVVVAVTMIKDLIEDYIRLLADRQANNVPVTIYRDGGMLMQLKSKDVKPGDIIEVKRDQPCPADIVVLSSTHRDDGRCFIQTAQLDGETNLKRRSALLHDGVGRITPESNLIQSVTRGYGRVDCEKPNPHLYRFEGRMDWVDGDRALSFSLSPENVILRGAVVKNTDSILGAVVYVGNETKIMKNMVKASLKFSTLEGRLNVLVVAIFVFNVITLALSSILSGFWQDQHGIYAWYIDWNETGAQVGLFHSATYFVLWTYLIPISLFVSIEIVRLCQFVFMHWDNSMGTTIDGEWVPMKPNNSNLNEDLGKIDHIFSDKTGTVTQNVMRLAAWATPDNVFSEEEGNRDHPVGALLTSYRYGVTAEKAGALALARLAAVCNTVTPEVRQGVLKYDGDSPDEIALMESLRLNGITLTERTKAGIVIEGEMLDGGRETWTIHNVLTFSSARKRMAVIASRPGSDELILFEKGADSVILERLANKDSPQVRAIIRHTDAFARRALRTLLLAKRTISRGEFDEYMKAFLIADQTVGSREQNLSKVFETIEHDLELVGCTAVEDKLQDHVPETIAYFLAAGIRFWLLTGDKLETAISVGVSCRLLQSATDIINISHATSLDDCRAKFEAERGRLSQDRGLIVDGTSLVHVLSEDLFKTFMEFADRSKSVIICRMSPQQKATVVSAVRYHVKCVTLAIGDGANDVGMIQKADVGVGVFGREGSQAARASDYAIGEFQLLNRLLTVVGRYSHLRLAEIINYSFYKNIAFIYVVFWFGFYSGWSGESIYQDSLMAAFNIFFTSLPPIMVAIFERDVDDTVIMKHPQLYAEARRGAFFNTRNTVIWTALAFTHSIIGFFISAFAFGLGGDSGSALDLRTANFYWSTTMLYVVMIRMALMTRTWVWPNWVVVVLSFGAYFGCLFLVGVFGWAYVGADKELFVRLEYWAATALVVGITFASDYGISYARRTYSPYDYQILQESGRYRGPNADEHEKSYLLHS